MNNANKESEYVGKLNDLIELIRKDQKEKLNANATPLQIADGIQEMQKVIGIISESIEAIKEI